MRAFRQISILLFVFVASSQARAQYWGYDSDGCPISGSCVTDPEPGNVGEIGSQSVKPTTPPGKEIDPKEKPAAPPTPSNKAPQYLRDAVSRCTAAADAAQRACDNATSNVRSKKSDLTAAANSLTGSTGQNCKMLADRAQGLKDDMGDWKSSCDKTVTDCNSACTGSSAYQELNNYDDGSSFQATMRSACTSPKSKASNIGQMLQDVAGTYVSLNQCLNDITGANAANQQTFQPLGNFAPQQANMQSQICALNPQACGSAGSTASPYTTPASQAGGGSDDSAPANTSLDMGSDRPSVSADDPNRQRNQPPPVDPSTLANVGQPANPGSGFNQLPPPPKRNGGGYSPPLTSPTEVYKGYYSNNAEASFRPGVPGGPAVQGELRKDLRPQVGSKLAPPSEVRQLLKAQMQTELNRKLAGYDRIDGIVGPDGLTGPHSQLWFKVRLRYKNIEPYLTP